VLNQLGSTIVIRKPLAVIIMSDLQLRVQALPYEHLVEAANFYLPDATGSADLQRIEGKLASEVQLRSGAYSDLQEFLREVRDDRGSTEYLLRTVLLHAAEGTEEERKRLNEALDGIGQSQMVAEVVFAIYAATLITVTWLYMPPQEIVETRKITTAADGSKTETIKTEIRDIPPPVGKLFSWIKGLAGGGIGQLIGSGDDDKNTLSEPLGHNSGASE
jgi:hypothetical protein